MDMTVWLYVLAGALIVIGLLGTFLPALPGMPLIFGGMLLAAWVGISRSSAAGCCWCWV